MQLPDSLAAISSASGTWIQLLKVSAKMSNAAIHNLFERIFSAFPNGSAPSHPEPLFECQKPAARLTAESGMKCYRRPTLGDLALKFCNPVFSQRISESAHNFEQVG